MDEKFWRTLIRVNSYTHILMIAHLAIPGWDAEKIIEISLEDVPDEVYYRILKGREHFHALVNLDAETENDIQIKGWELE